MRDEHGHLQANVYSAISWREVLDAVESLVESGEAKDFCQRDEERLEHAARVLRSQRLAASKKYPGQEFYHQNNSSVKRAEDNFESGRRS